MHNREDLTSNQLLQNPLVSNFHHEATLIMANYGRIELYHLFEQVFPNFTAGIYLVL